MRSTRCKDINVRFTVLPKTTEVRALPCTNQAAWIGDWYTFNNTGSKEDAIGWQVIVERVPVDTCFYVEMRSISGNTYQVVGEVAY
jgi:hypothetical protein